MDTGAPVQASSVIERIEPMYPLDVAAELIPMPSVVALYQFLNRNRDQFPGRYRTSGGRGVRRGGYEQRFLTESEILRIRDMTFHGIEGSRFANKSTASRGPIARIIARAMEA